MTSHGAVILEQQKPVPVFAGLGSLIPYALLQYYSHIQQSC